MCLSVSVCVSVCVCSQEQHLDLLAECATSAARTPASASTVTTLGLSLDGRPLDMLTIGEGPLNVWAIARQVRVWVWV